MDLLGGVQKVMRHMLVARGVESKVVSVGGQSVHMYELRGQGKGPPVVLVHGLAGSANGFSAIFLKLAKRFSRVLALDFPGHGFSAEYCGGPVCVRSQFEVLRLWCEQVVGEPSIVVGNSLGGAMAVKLAAEYPELVKALALVAPAGAALAPEVFDALLASFDVRTPADARALGRRLFHKPPLPVMLFAGEFKKFYGTPTVQALRAEAIATRESLTPESLRSLKMPVLVLWGGSERLLPAETLDYYRAHLPPHAQIRVVEGFGHIPQVERPDELVSHLVRFADTAGI